MNVKSQSELDIGRRETCLQKRLYSMFNVFRENAKMKGEEVLNLKMTNKTILTKGIIFFNKLQLTELSSDDKKISNAKEDCEVVKRDLTPSPVMMSISRRVMQL